MVVQVLATAPDKLPRRHGLDRREVELQARRAEKRGGRMLYRDFEALQLPMAWNIIDDDSDETPVDEWLLDLTTRAPDGRYAVRSTSGGAGSRRYRRAQGRVRSGSHGADLLPGPSQGGRVRAGAHRGGAPHRPLLHRGARAGRRRDLPTHHGVVSLGPKADTMREPHPVSGVECPSRKAGKAREYLAGSGGRTGTEHLHPSPTWLGAGLRGSTFT